MRRPSGGTMRARLRDSIVPPSLHKPSADADRGGRGGGGGVCWGGGAVSMETLKPGLKAKRDCDRLPPADQRCSPQFRREFGWYRRAHLAVNLPLSDRRCLWTLRPPPVAGLFVSGWYGYVSRAESGRRQRRGRRVSSCALLPTHGESLEGFSQRMRWADFYFQLIWGKEIVKWSMSLLCSVQL